MVCLQRKLCCLLEVYTFRAPNPAKFNQKRKQMDDCISVKLSVFYRILAKFLLLFRSKMPKYGFSVWIGGISDRVRTADVEDLVRGYGKILDVSLKGKFGKHSF